LKIMLQGSLPSEFHWPGGSIKRFHLWRTSVIADENDRDL
jgi:hypothetical protein